MMEQVNNEVYESLSTLQKFYEGKNIFLTGGTGFLGKVLTEKLLRSTGVSTIYMLVREKKGKGVHARIDELLDEIIFDKVKLSNQKYKHKVIGISGDCSLAGLGISLNDRNMLERNVDIVFHAAATVRFDEDLDLAYAINVNGTKHVINLCRNMENLKAFVHVSTAYANCHLAEIEEKFYEYPVNYEDVEAMLDKMSKEEIKESTSKILGNWPNTYAFTKALAEAMIQDKTNGMPIGVFRPAIVVSTYKEPFPSWIDNLYGPTGACAAVASGLLKSMQCKDSGIANVVPVDTCVAALLASAWDVSCQTKERIKENIPIYNYVSTTENPITWLEYNTFNTFYGHDYPFLKSIWCISFSTTISEHVNVANRIVYHFIPACFLDALLLISGQRPKFIKMYQKVHKYTAVIEYFCTRDWTFTNDNVQQLHEKMDSKDKRIFPMSMRDVHWRDYFKTYVLGIRQYVMKESEESLPESRTRMYRLEILNKTIKFVIYYIIASVAWSLIASVFSR